MVGFVAAGTNLVVGFASCITFLLLSGLPLVNLIGVSCPLYLGYTGGGVALLGGITTTSYDRIPGSGTLVKLAVLVGVSMLIYISGTFLPTVPPLRQPAGLGVNLLYYGISSVTAMGAAMYVYHRYVR